MRGHSKWKNRRHARKEGRLKEQRKNRGKEIRGMGGRGKEKYTCVMFAITRRKKNRKKKILAKCSDNTRP